MTIPESGVGVVDRSVAILSAVESGARTLGEISSATGLPRPTAHRLAVALTFHDLLARDPAAGGWRLGLRLLGLGAAAGRSLSIREAARPSLERLRDETGESTQLYVRVGDTRVCIDVAESGRELRTIVPLGASLPLGAGSAGKVFTAFAPEEERARLVALASRPGGHNPVDPAALRNALNEAVALGWAQSVGEREAGVASVSAPILDRSRHCLGAVSVSGPIERTGRDPGRRYADQVTAAARRIESALGALR